MKIRKTRQLVQMSSFVTPFGYFAAGMLPRYVQGDAWAWSTDLRIMIRHCLLQDLMFVVLGGPCHAAGPANAAVGYVPPSSNFLAGVNNYHQLLKPICQELCDVPQQSGFACTASMRVPMGCRVGAWGGRGCGF